MSDPFFFPSLISSPLGFFTGPFLPRTAALTTPSHLILSAECIHGNLFLAPRFTSYGRKDNWQDIRLLEHVGRRVNHALDSLVIGINVDFGGHISY